MRESIEDIISDLKDRAEYAHDAWLGDPNDSIGLEELSGIYLKLAGRLETCKERAEP